MSIARRIPWKEIMEALRKAELSGIELTTEELADGLGLSLQVVDAVTSSLHFQGLIIKANGKVRLKGGTT